MNETTTACIVCGENLRKGQLPWHFFCCSCGYEGSTLANAINETDSHAEVDEGARARGLEGIRQENFRVLTSMARSFAAPGARALLDVGCAHGWFLEQASEHFDVLGLEPDREVGRQTASRGLAVREGYFPGALREKERFDVIVFNDVIEHIPEIRQALAECHRRLNERGILVLNLPNSAGTFYRLAKLLARVGAAGPFKRMWQFAVPSPHVHYFNSGNLAPLVTRCGFVLRHQREMRAIQHEGLLDRMRCVGKAHPLSLYITYIAICCILPFLRMLPSDIMVLIFEKQGTAA
jgi:SAM-dependent methyltransferase